MSMRYEHDGEKEGSWVAYEKIFAPLAGEEKTKKYTDSDWENIKSEMEVIQNDNDQFAGLLPVVHIRRVC